MRHLLLLAFAVAVPSSVMANEPSDAEKRSAAEAIFAQASDLMGRGDYPTACTKLEEVVRLQPHGVGAQLKLAECYEQAGRLASAQTTFKKAASMASLAGQEERARTATERATALDQRVSTITFVVKDRQAMSAGLTLMRGSMPVPTSQLNVPIPIDGGKHPIAASAEGYKPFAAALEAAPEQGRYVVELALERLDTTQALLASKPNETARQEPATSLPPVRIAGIVVGAAGLALGVAGIVAGVTGIAKTEDAATRYSAAEDEAQAAQASADHESGRTQLTAGWVLAGVGGAGLVSGVIMIAAAPSGAIEPTAASWKVAPWPGGASVVGRW